MLDDEILCKDLLGNLLVDSELFLHFPETPEMYHFIIIYVHLATYK